MDTILLVAILTVFAFSSITLSTALATMTEEMLQWKEIALRWQNDYHDLRSRYSSGSAGALNECKHCGLLHRSVDDAIEYHTNMATHYKDYGNLIDADAEQQLVDALKLARKR